MKNPAQSGGVSSVEKKKSRGLFSFCRGYPAIIGVEIEPPQDSPA
jgi:hypothetical protein